MYSVGDELTREMFKPKRGERREGKGRGRGRKARKQDMDIEVSQNGKQEEYRQGNLQRETEQHRNISRRKIHIQKNKCHPL